MIKLWTVYRHISPSGKVYIGITSKKSPASRWGKDGYNYRSSVLFHKAIQKYGWDNIKHEVLFTNLPEERAKNLEIDLVSHYKNLNLSYNITEGGQGTTGLRKTEEEKENLRRLHIGKKLSEETRRKMSEARRGRPGTMLGRKHSEETKKKMSISRSGQNNPVLGRVRTEEEKTTYRLAQKTRKKVAKIDPGTGNILDTYNSVNEAGNINKCSCSHISECCRGKSKLFKGYKWIFIDG